MRRLYFGMTAIVASVALIASPASSQPPAGKDGKGKGAVAGAVKLGSVLPPALVSELKLTDEQKARLADIEKEVKAKLDQLLTDEQKKLVENYRPAATNAKGAAGGGKAGKGAGKGNPPGENKPAGQAQAILEAPAIQWYATLDRGMAEAKRTGKPILFVSAAPHCAGVSGMW